MIILSLFLTEKIDDSLIMGRKNSFWSVMGMGLKMG